jgi:hypothetical protein
MAVSSAITDGDAFDRLSDAKEEEQMDIIIAAPD